MNEKIYILIADFQFELIFYPHRKEIIDSFQRQLLFLDGYIGLKTNRKSNIIIEIHNSRQKLQLFSKLNEILIPIAENTQNDVVKTSYNISIPQLIVLLHSLLIRCLAKSKDTILIHASGVQDKFGAYLFLGKNESGKSTSAQLAADGKRIFPFCDDMCIIRIKNSTVTCYPVAIFEGRPNSFKNNAGIPLIRIYSIYKSDWFQISKLNSKEDLIYIRRLFKEQARFMYAKIKLSILQKFINSCKDAVYLLFLQKKQLDEVQRKQLMPLRQ